MKITFKGQTKECKYYKGLNWDKPLTEKMKEFKKKTGKNPVYRGKITGQFEYWLYWEDFDKSLKKPRGFQKGHSYSKGRAGAKKAPGKRAPAKMKTTKKK